MGFGFADLHQVHFWASDKHSPDDQGLTPHPSPFLMFRPSPHWRNCAPSLAGQVSSSSPRALAGPSSSELCGPHCSLWGHCACGAPGVTALGHAGFTFSCA